jgi:hypothetical protein
VLVGVTDYGKDKGKKIKDMEALGFWKFGLFFDVSDDKATAVWK